MKRAILAAVVCTVCVDWTRLSGIVKRIDLQNQTVTIEDRSDNILTVPVDYQVKLIERHGELRDLPHLDLGEKITLTRTPMEKPKETDDSAGMALPEPAQRGK